MPWNVVDKLEDICNYLVKNNISIITLNDLEIVLMKKAKISKPETVNNYIKILLKFGWIKQIKNENGSEFKFKITYDNKNNELF
jgi:hypothetical protein